MPETRRLLRRPRPAEAYEDEEDDQEEQEAARPRLRRVPSNRRDDDHDDDSDLVVGEVHSGWGGYSKTKANAPSKWTKLYKVHDEEALILFLQDSPYASFNMHWCDWVPKGHRMSYVCLRPEPCPLDEVDSQGPTSRIRFNILDLSCDPPDHTTFECGITVAETIAKYQPIQGAYFAACMTGPKKQRRTQIRPVKARDLLEDWKVKPLTEEQIHAFDRRLWDDSSVERSTRAEIQAVADLATE
jgi:hypothetical protein